MNNKKLNTGKAKGDIFRRKNDRPTKQELQELKTYYNKLTAAVSDETAMDILDSPEKFHFLMLLKVADYAKLGKSWAILTAAKIGYIAGKGGTEYGQN
mgnify:CR=1 FL=1